MISHGHFLLNGKKCDVPSVLVKIDDVVRACERKKTKQIVELALEYNKNQAIPPWLELDESQLGGIVRELPLREHIQFEIEEQLIVEFMSK